MLQRIRGECVIAIQCLREAQYRVVAARSAREAAQRVLLSDQRRFQAGTSTTFLILQRQLDVANQQLHELQAQSDLDKAIVELNRVSGGIFAQNGIDTSALGGASLDATSPTQQRAANGLNGNGAAGDAPALTLWAATYTRPARPDKQSARAKRAG